MRDHRRTTATALGLLAILWVACVGGDAKNVLTGGGDNGATGGEGGSDGGTDQGGGVTSLTIGSGGTGGGDIPCDETVNDFDQDGYTTMDGDCNDCDANVNPGAIEVPTDTSDANAEEVDENCDGNIDEAIPTCDDALSIDDTDAESAAMAMDICDVATPGGKDFGVLQAYWAHADGTPASAEQLLQFGIHDSFGSNVSAQGGSQLLMLSSGFARLPGDPEAAEDHRATAQDGVSSTAPSGFPQNVPGCEGGTEIFDDIALNVRMRAPTNATGFKYRFKFYSFEFAEYVCTQFNDQYIALVDPPPMGSINGNVTFDGNGNPVSVNLAFFDVCDPVTNNDFAANCFAGCPPAPTPYCPVGPAELMGTGFDNAFGADFPEDAGATIWLETTVPIEGGEEFNFRVAIWDTGDATYDSTVLLDNFQWIATPGTTVTTQPPPD